MHQTIRYKRCRTSLLPVTGCRTMFECQYNDEMEAEVNRLEAQARAITVGHPEWLNACASCGCELATVDVSLCERCNSKQA